MYSKHFLVKSNMLLLCLQMAVLEIQGNGESSYVPQEAINSAIQLLEDPLQRVSEGGSAPM